MAQVITNLITLALKNKNQDSMLDGATLTLDDDTVIIVAEWSYDDNVRAFIIDATNGNQYVVDGRERGIAENTTLANPSNGNRQKIQKLKK